MTSTGTVMPPGGFTDGARAAAVGLGGKADGDFALVGAAVTGAALIEVGETAGMPPAGPTGDRALDGTPA
jgi:hypothetical protein